MGLDDLADEEKNSVEKEETEELKEELGVEDKEELERLDDRLENISSIAIQLDKKMEELEEEISNIRSTRAELLKYMKKQSNSSDENDGGKEGSGGTTDGEPSWDKYWDE